jgi:hypothetical protein
MTEIQYLLGCLAEECAEVAIRASKAQRFGTLEVQSGQALTNAGRISAEMNDVKAILEMLEDRGAPVFAYDDDQIKAKKAKLAKFMAYSRECGTLEC